MILVLLVATIATGIQSARLITQPIKDHQMSDPNSQFTRNQTFQFQHVLNEIPRDVEDERRALRYLDRHAPDLVPMILGGFL